MFYQPEPPINNTTIGFLRIKYEKEIINDNYESVLFKSILIAFTSLLIGSLIAFFMARSVTTPLKRLNKGVHDLGEGDFTVKIPVETKDEIGQLATAFNNMVELLTEREAEKQKLQKQLNQSQRLEAIETLAGGISHDFNNILTIIHSNMELAQNKAPDYVQHYLDKTLMATKRGMELVTHLLNFSHDVQINMEAINLDLILQETIILLKNQADPEIVIQVNCESNLNRIRGDAGQIQQVIINLVNNAVDATNDLLKKQHPNKQTEKGLPLPLNIDLKNIDITEEYCRKHPQASEGEFVLLSVRDKGSGIDDKALNHIFEPFFTTKNINKGTGLGLSSVYGIVERHRGWIDVQSQVGKGSTFNVYFPKSQYDISPQESTKEQYRIASGNETILLVDDEEYILDTTSERLKELGYKVLKANDGEEAIEIIDNNSSAIDLVVLDNIMPGISGIEVLQHIRQQNNKIKVLMSSGKDLNTYSHFLKGVELCNKPYTFEDMTSKIRKILGPASLPSLKSSIRRVKLYYVDEKTAPFTDKLTDIETIYKLFRHIANEPRERFISIYLDSNNTIIAYDNLSSGTTDKATVYPKEIIRSAMLANTSSVILVHNHPSGNLEPSSNDIIITAAVAQACNLMEIALLDHLIIGENDYYSFSQNDDL
jgi:signal transduction histidine kinase/DNA repair protein RadC